MDYLPPLSFTRSFNKRLTSQDNESLVTFLDFDQITTPYKNRLSNFEMGISIYLENLLAGVYLPSFSKAPFPDNAPEDTARERSIKYREIELNYSRVKLGFHQQSFGTDWEEIDTITLQNRGGRFKTPLLQPVLTTGQVEFFGEYDKLGFSIIDDGYGKLLPPIISSPRGILAGDNILVRASVRFEFSLVRKEKQSIPNTPSFGVDVGTSPIQVLPANPNRKFLYITNAGDADCFIQFGSASINQPNTGAFLVSETGSFYYETTNYAITSAVYAVSVDELTRVTGIEGY